MHSNDASNCPDLLGLVDFSLQLFGMGFLGINEARKVEPNKERTVENLHQKDAQLALFRREGA
jgi:hypothetical protein